MTADVTAVRPVPWRLVVPAGIAIGIVYVLSPLTVFFAIAMIWLVHRAVRGTAGEERRWVLALLVTAIVVRVAAVAGLFAFTNHAQVPFGSFFGDEEYFIRRSIWLRNVAEGIPIHVADLIYAFDEYSDTSYLYLLAYVQFLVGTAPYGVHLLGIAFYMAGAVVLYRLARESFGSLAAFVGLGLILWLPTLFAWSISALKDPLFFLLSALALGGAMRIVRASRWWRRIAAAVAVAAIAVVLGTVRQAGDVLVIASVGLGLAVAFFVRRPRATIAAVVVLPIVVGLALQHPEMQLRAFSAVRIGARQHAGHISTPGWTYKLLDTRVYEDPANVDDIHLDETMRYLVRAVERYVTVPFPWEVESSAALAYLPEQLVWWGIVVLFVPGVVFAFRRDSLLGSLLLGYSTVAALVIALTSGNVGTLIRHRGLALPYIVWLSAVGGCELLGRSRRVQPDAESAGPADPVLTRFDPLWR